MGDNGGNIWDQSGTNFNGTCWERDTGISTGTSIETIESLDILETAGVHAIRFNFSTTSTNSNIGITVVSDNTPTPGSFTLDFSSSPDLQNVQFDFDPAVPLAPSGVPFQIAVSNVGDYRTTLYCDIELLVDAEREQEFLALA